MSQNSKEEGGEKEKGLNIIDTIVNFMGKRQTVNTTILVVIILAFMVFPISKNVWISALLILIAFLLGMFRRQVYRIL